MKKNSALVLCLFFMGITLCNSQSNACCGEAYRKLRLTTIIPDRDTCRYIAFRIQSNIDDSREIALEKRTITPRDLQTKKTNTPNSVSALNQGDAAPALYPFALGGGSVGGTGSEGGTNALTTLSLNPAIFFADMDNAGESAKWGRLMDMSVILPLNEIQSGALDKLSYLGIRARVNTLGSLKGSKLDEQAAAAFREVLENAGQEQQRIKDLMMNASNCEKCIEQLNKFSLGQGSASAVSLACNGEFGGTDGDAIYKAFDEKLQELLEEADKKYFGLDLRGDFGDPTLGAVDSARGTSLYAGVGWGKSFKGDQDASKNFRLSLGLRYKDLETVDANAFDLDGAAGFDITWPYQFQQIKLGVGLEFRKNFEKNVDDMTVMDLTEAFETDYLFFRTSLNIPITPSNSFSFQYGTAIAGEKSTVLSLNFNWKLLLEDD